MLHADIHPVAPAEGQCDNQVDKPDGYLLVCHLAAGHEGDHFDAIDLEHWQVLVSLCEHPERSGS